MPVNLRLAFDVVIATLVGLFALKRKTRLLNTQSNNSCLCLEQVGAALLVFAFIFIVIACTPGFWEIPSHIIKALCVLQFPWRLVGPTVVITSVCLCISSKLILAYFGRTAQLLFVTVVAALALLESGYMLTTYVQDNGLAPEVVEENADFNSVASGVSGGEYLPSNADLGSIESLAASVGCLQGYEGNGYSISYSDAKGGRIFTIASDGSVSRFDLPLTWCGYYKAQGAGDVNLSQSDDGLVQVELPEAKTCTFTVRFESPKHWILYDLLSFIGVFVCVYLKPQSRR